MRVILIPEENRVNVEGFSQAVDLSELYAADVHVIHWYGDKGEIEHWQGDAPKIPTPITDFSPYQKYVDAWETKARAT